MAENAPREIVCLWCPRSCTLSVMENYAGLVVRGQACAKGRDFARQELIAPQRVLTTTVTVNGAAIKRLAVKSSSPLPRELLKQAAQEAHQVAVQAPVHIGDVIIQDLCGTGVSLVSTRNLPAAP